MLVTEAEAKTRWCPFIRMSNGPDGSWNTMRDVRDETAYFCRGAECMAWRVWMQAEPARGYCGLAGAP